MATDTCPPATPSAELDRRLMAAVGRVTGALSPTLAWLSYVDWIRHMAVAPGHQFELMQLAISQRLSLQPYFLPWPVSGMVSQPAPSDPLPNWATWPYNLWRQSYDLSQQWWVKATTDVPGVSRHHSQVVRFAATELLKLYSPEHNPFTNPDVLRRTWDEWGANFARGALFALDDAARQALGQPTAGTDAFVVGRDVAVTPGDVVLRNDIMELIHYHPRTPQVRPEPVLVVPAWIMKYYILDLSPENSLIRYLLDQGYDVFCISWKNPGYAQRHLGMDDYLTDGFYKALDVVCATVPDQQVHALGYCLGGTLLGIAAAAMARDGDNRLKSLSMLAAQTDFSEPGELSLFIDESQVTMLESVMADTGYLTAEQMAGAFKLLRSDYLVWDHWVNTYLMGQREPQTDLMAWNADATRMPACMHSQYLRRLFLDNDLAEGRYPVQGRPVALNDIRVPVFSLGTTTDHVAPWRSVYKIHLLVSSEVTFVLTTGGHNAGVISQPGHPHRSFHRLTRGSHQNYLGPDEWLAHAGREEGSWWPAYAQWLNAHSSPATPRRRVSASRLPYPALYPAPGNYVLEK
ncbi:MAG: PHA/PHB synthase family protein [Burkholderiaceae bacterium]